MTLHTKLIGTIVLAAALLAPVAQAQSPDDRAGMRGPGAFETTQPSASHPDNRADRSIGAQVAPVEPQWMHALEARGQALNEKYGLGASTSRHPDNRAEVRGPGAFTPTVVVASTSNGFDWGDALIGGLGGVGLAFLLTGCAFLLTSQRNKARLA